jgi:hypothetical protein
MTFYVEIIQPAGDWEGLCLSLIPYAFIFYILYCSWKIASTFMYFFVSKLSREVSQFREVITNYVNLFFYDASIVTRVSDIGLMIILNAVPVHKKGSCRLHSKVLTSVCTGRTLQWCLRKNTYNQWSLESYGLYRSVVVLKLTDVSEVHTAYIIIALEAVRTS